jgi:quercetin 2,3-dioxygenase
MTNLEAHPAPVECVGGTGDEGVEIQIITPRDVPLGGPRAMNVRRTLPARSRSLIGAWCFLDHYGPDDVVVSGGMEVPPHPHTGLATVSWLFTGEVEHRDSVGTVAIVRPGEVNLMTSGRGISHSENSTAETTVLHGAQLWVALPDEFRDVEPGFENHRPTPIEREGATVRVFMGSLLGSTSPVRTYSEILGAEILLEPGARLEIPVESRFEHGVLVDTGEVSMTGVGASGPASATVTKDSLAYAPPGATTLVLQAGEAWTRLLLLGGPPFGESIIMWWNFVGRTHDEVVGYRQEWQDQVTRGGGEVVEDSQDLAEGRFGVVEGNHQRPIPAPPLPNARLRSRS